MYTAIYDAYTKKPVPSGMATSNIDWANYTFIRANRTKLRDYFATAIYIKWGKRLTHYEIGGDGRVKAFFEDGTVTEGDIIIGADGVRSRGIIIDLNRPLNSSLTVCAQFATPSTSPTPLHST